MNKTGSTAHLAPTKIQKMFFEWAVKWFYGNASEDTSTKPDIVSIICLLQAIGFQLRSFEKQDQLTDSENAIKNDSVKITMECGSSKMVATMEMDSVNCDCPKTTEEKDNCSFWSVTGIEPMGSIDFMNKIEQTGSKLVPEMSKEIKTVVRDIIYRLIKIIHNKADFDASEDLASNNGNSTIVKSKIKEGLVRSYTDFFSHKPSTLANMTSNLASSRTNLTRSSKDSIASDKPKFKRQGTYDIDDESIDEPRPSPPKIASSPVLGLSCKSLGQISLQSDEELVHLGDYVVKAHQILEKAITHIIKKMPFSTSQSSIPDDINFVKPTPPTLMSSSFFTPGSQCSLNSDSNSLINRSTSSATLSRPSSACSVTSRSATQGNRSIPKPLTRRSGTPNTLVPMPDRSSSLTKKPSPKTTVLTTTSTVTRRKSSAAISTTGLAQRNTSVTSKLPTCKLGTRKSTGNLYAEKLSSVRRSNVSPRAKSQSASNSSLNRSTASLVKPPSKVGNISVSGSNTSKFGFSSTKN